MKKSREYKLSVAFSSVAIILFVISLVTGLIPDFKYSIDKTCMYLGFAFMFLGVIYLKKSNGKGN